MGTCKNYDVLCNGNASSVAYVSGNGSSSVSSYGNLTIDMSDDWDWKDNINIEISKYDEIIKASARRIDLDWRLCAAQAWQESKFNPNAKNNNAIGMWQIIYWPSGYSPDYDVEKSTLAWEQLMREGLNRCKGAKTRNDQIAMALQQYHDGCSTKGAERATRTPGKYGTTNEALKYARHTEKVQVPFFANLL